MASQSQLREQVKQLGNLPIKDICKLTGATYNQVWRALSAEHKPQTSPEEVEEMVSLRLMGDTVEQISTMFGRCPQTVSKLTSKFI